MGPVPHAARARRRGRRRCAARALSRARAVGRAAGQRRRRAPRGAIDKFRTSWELARAGLSTPEARVVQTRAQAREALDALGDVVVKPVYGSLGVGVERVGRRADGAGSTSCSPRAARSICSASSTARSSTCAPSSSAIASRRRWRAAAREGDFRGNTQQGSTTCAIRSTTTCVGLALAATRAVGLDYSGVDLLVGADGAHRARGQRDAFVPRRSSRSRAATWRRLIVAHAIERQFTEGDRANGERRNEREGGRPKGRRGAGRRPRSATAGVLPRDRARAGRRSAPAAGTSSTRRSDARADRRSAN